MLQMTLVEIIPYIYVFLRLDWKIFEFITLLGLTVTYT